MAFTTVFLLAPLALIGAVVYTYLLLDKIRPFERVRSRAVRRFLLSAAYIVSIPVLTVVLIIAGMALVAGIIGLPVLLVLDIIGIVILIAVRLKKVK